MFSPPQIEFQQPANEPGDCGRLIPGLRIFLLPKLLASHDAGLFTSRVEGWGLTLQEMLESGMPVYATNPGAVADLRTEFPDLLREFPPGFGERIADPDPSPVSQSYLSQCSWAAIAADYLAKIHEKA